MCFGPSAAEQRAAAEAQRQQAEAARLQREAAEAAAREEAERRAKAKAEDIDQAIRGRDVRQGMSGGAGRRSLFSASGGGFLGRFS